MQDELVNLEFIVYGPKHSSSSCSLMTRLIPDYHINKAGILCWFTQTCKIVSTWNLQKCAIWKLIVDAVLTSLWMYSLILAAEDFYTSPTCPCSWCRHQIEAFSALLALCEGNPPVTGAFPLTKASGRALMFSLTCPWTNDWASNRRAGDLRRHRTHHDVTVMDSIIETTIVITRNKTLIDHCDSLCP